MVLDIVEVVMLIEKAKLSDAKSLATLLEEARLYKISVGDETWGDKPYTIKELRESIPKNNTYVVRIDTVAVATFVLIYKDTQFWPLEIGMDGSALYLHRFAIKNSFRGKKLGQQIIKWIATEADNKKLDYIRLDCNKNNKKLCEHYKNLGFKEFSATKSKHGLVALFQRTI
jgi:ribosomal protein S18 acetylase RimI-like enzyme